MNPQWQAALEGLKQTRELLDHLDDELYQATLPSLPQGTVGSHVRHVLDFYSCFLRDHESGRVDYDARERDERLEAELAYARGHVRELVRALGTHDLERSPALTIRTNAVVDDESAFTRTSVRRELQFLADHVTHHMAIVVVILAAHDFDVGAVGGEIGIAPSTLAYWKKKSPNAAR